MVGVGWRENLASDFVKMKSCASLKRRVSCLSQIVQLALVINMLCDKVVLIADGQPVQQARGSGPPEKGLGGNSVAEALIRAV